MSPPAALHEPFEDIDRQRLSTALGMWVFLASEMLFFGSLFLGMTVYRHLHPGAMLEAARHTDIVLGTLNTALLLASSVTIAVADKAADAGARRHAVLCLAATAALGLAFLAVKGFEYRKDVVDGLVPGPHFSLEAPAAEIFYAFYWVMTGLHAVHLSIGIVAVSLIAWRVHARRLAFRQSAAVPSLALYWHLVDIVWIFLYPLLYLGGRA